MTPLNEAVLAVLAALPRGGCYVWTGAWSDGDGCTEDFVHRGTRLLRRGAATYCCGLTLEVLYRAWAATRWPDLNSVALSAIRRDWFVAGEARTGPVAALVPRDLAIEVPPEDAQPGDFAQLWRRNGSGHSIVVLEVKAGRIRYLSTQRSTSGIGETSERIQTIHIARALVPPELK
jgi:hypothetical protein